MEYLTSSSEKLVYLIDMLELNGKIDKEERSKLENLLKENSDKVYLPIEQYKSDNDFQQLCNQVVAIVKPGKFKPSKVAIPPKELSDDISSPLGTYLYKKKKTHKKPTEFKLSVNFTYDAEDVL